MVADAISGFKCLVVFRMDERMGATATTQTDRQGAQHQSTHILPQRFEAVTPKPTAAGWPSMAPEREKWVRGAPIKSWLRAGSRSGERTPNVQVHMSFPRKGVPLTLCSG